MMFDTECGAVLISGLSGAPPSSRGRCLLGDIGAR
jgi:hypothetical protein